MEKKLNFVLDVLLKAQDYTNGEMEAICDTDAMESAKELFEQLDEAIVKIKSLMANNQNPEETDTFKRTWVGYQVKTKDDKFIPPYTDKDVFRSIEDAQNVIRSQRNSIFISPEEKTNLVIVSRWLENEDEEKRDFTFQGFKNRSFEKDEKVWDDENNLWVTVRMDTSVCHEDDLVSVWAEDSGYVAKADDLYQLAEDKTCPRCGNPLCKEHCDDIDYPYYCPDCTENFYEIEL